MLENDVKTIVSKLSERINRLFEGVETWVHCPSCGEEWNNLRLCKWHDGEMEQSVSLCVRCAETCRALPWITKNYPRGLEARTVPDFPDQFYVGYGAAFIFRVWRDGVRIKVRREGMIDKITEHENVISAYFSIWRTIQAGDDPNPQKEGEWASEVKFERNKRGLGGTGRRKIDQGGLL